MNIDKPVQQSIKNEAVRIEEDALYSYKGHFNAGDRWSHIHLWLGIPTAILAAWAGLQAFSDYPALTALLAIVSAGMGACSTFLNPSEKSTNHLNAGAGYNELRNNTRRFREVSLLQLDDKNATDQLQVLAETRNQLNGSSPGIPSWAYEKAKRDIEAGHAIYEVDKDCNDS